jgi:hypothetical protein
LTSVGLREALLAKEVHTIGTLRKHRGEPPEIKNPTKMKKHEVISRDNGKVMVLACKDKRIVKVISTKHDDSVCSITRIVKGGQRQKEIITKPAAVVDYNKHMSGVDHLNQMLAYYPTVRKSLKWTTNCFFYLMTISVHNSFILYKANNPGDTMAYFDFIHALIKQHCESQEAERQDSSNVAMVSTSRFDPPGRLRGGVQSHALEMLPLTASQRQSRRRCRVCSRGGKRTNTAYFCKNCNVPLCRAPCYNKYHTQKKYT